MKEKERNRIDNKRNEKTERIKNPTFTLGTEVGTKTFKRMFVTILQTSS